jgi:hypothetical protein
MVSYGVDGLEGSEGLIEASHVGGTHVGWRFAYGGIVGSVFKITEAVGS